MSQKEISELIKRYEQQLASGKSIYFDADEFEDLAEYYDSQEDLESAREVITAGLRIHPESISLLIKKAKFVVYDGKYEKALSLLSGVSEYDFDLYLLKIECYLQLDMMEEAKELTSEVEKNEDDQGTALSELGFLYIESDNFEEAIQFLSRSLEYDPENMDVLSDLAYAYEVLGNFDGAIAMNNKILDIDSYTYEAWINVGKLYSVNEQFEKAIDAFDFALTINDSDTNVLKLKAHCLSICGRGEEAIAIFNELLQENPEDISVHFLLAECYISLDMFEEALLCLDKYEKNEGKKLEIILKRAYIYLQKEDYQNAWAMISGVLSNDNSFEITMIAGEIKFKQGILDDAIRYFKEAYKQNRDNFHLIDRLAVLSIKMENYPEALSFSKELLEMEPYNLAAKQRLALLYFELDDKDNFNEILANFEEEELQALFTLVYNDGPSYNLNRQQITQILNEARECRTLFKNLKY